MLSSQITEKIYQSDYIFLFFFPYIQSILIFNYELKLVSEKHTRYTRGKFSTLVFSIKLKLLVYVMFSRILETICL